MTASATASNPRLPSTRTSASSCRGSQGHPKAPGTLEEALTALAEDNEFLQAGGVFTQDLIDTWIEYKYENEIKPLSLRPNPYEFELYYGV